MIIRCGLMLAAVSLTACHTNIEHTSGVDPDEQLKNASALEHYLKQGLIESYRAYATDDMAYETAGDAASAPEADSSNDSYSETTTQEEGVDEADLVKQNGSYLYAVKQSGYSWYDSSQATVEVYQTSGNPVSSQWQTSINLGDTYNVSGLYLLDQQLAVLGSSSVGQTAKTSDEGDISVWSWQDYATDVRLLDTSNPAAPQQQQYWQFEGYLINSRRIGNQLYLAVRFTPDNWYPWSYEGNITDWQQTVLNAPLTDLLPRVWKNGEAAGYLFEDGQCYLPDLDENGGYPGIVSLIRINLDDPDDWQASCNSGRLHGVYASTDAFVLTGYSSTDWDSTRLDWYDLASFSLKASAVVPGTLDGSMPSFRISESDGLLRVITSSQNFMVWDAVAFEDVAAEPDTVSTAVISTSSEWDHRLFVLEPDGQGGMTLAASLPNDDHPQAIGKPGERVQAVRFHDDRAYVVTFRNTDPLYVINLSDSRDPWLEGELEIEGFSAFLQPLDNHLLLGLGRAADANGTLQGLKLSLFDVSDASAPTEVSSMELGGSGAWSQALWDHHAISFMDTDSGTRMAFTWSDYSDWNWQGNRLAVFDIDTTTPALTSRVDYRYQSPSDSDGYWYYYQYTRALLHNDGVHLVTNGDVDSRALPDWQ